MEYPSFYKKENRCLKRDGDVTAVELKIPSNGDHLPIVHHLVTFPSKERLDEEVTTMEKIDNEVYESYLAALFQAAELNRKKFNQIRQKRYEAQMSKEYKTN